GFNADHDHTVSEEIRFVQLTPPGSACSIAIGKGLVEGEPGSVKGLQMVVPDIEAAHAELVARGADVSGINDLAWGRFVFFADPAETQWPALRSPPRAKHPRVAPPRADPPPPAPSPPPAPPPAPSAAAAPPAGRTPGTAPAPPLGGAWEQPSRFH